MASELTGTPNLASWRMLSAVGTQGISNDSIYAMIEGAIVEHQLKGKVLDYGAGVGNLTRRFFPMGVFQQIFAVDLLPAPTDLKVSKWLQQDLNEPIPGYDDFFDVIIA